MINKFGIQICGIYLILHLYYTNSYNNMMKSNAVFQIILIICYTFHNIFHQLPPVVLIL